MVKAKANKKEKLRLQDCLAAGKNKPQPKQRKVLRGIIFNEVYDK